MANSEDEAFENSLKELEVTDPERAAAARWWRANRAEKQAENQKEARRAEEALRSYKIAWDGQTVTIPAAGELNPDGVSWTNIRPTRGSIRGYHDLRLIEFANKMFTAQGKQQGTIAVPLVLIPRPDNPHDPDAVSIAMPRSMGGDAEERCLGYLYRRTLDYWGIANNERRDLVARLAAIATDGEVHFTGVMAYDDPLTPLSELDTTDDLEVVCALPGLSLDLPGARIMGGASREVLDRVEHHGPPHDLDR